MKSRWILNLLLLLIVAGLGVYVYQRPAEVMKQEQNYNVANFDVGSVTHLRIEVPAKKALVFEKVNGRWMMVEPYQGRADELSVGRVLSVALATSAEKQPLTDAAQFGLDNPKMIVKADDKAFSFGMFNPVGGLQFVAHENQVFTLDSKYGESATVQPLEFMDKHPLAKDEVIAGFDFGALEQWEGTSLNVDRSDDGKWKVSAASKYMPNPNQAEMNDWFVNWAELRADSVEPYMPSRQPNPFVLVKLKGGKVIKLVKMQESPELLLVREDEQKQYHFQQDVGFTILNPPVGFKTE
ncbi:MAG: DUF4340 domain-containing protein [Methylophilales bacterium]|nr:DUF4340 domain-containing protein [Methylophilales bacterium]